MLRTKGTPVVCHQQRLCSQSLRMHIPSRPFLATVPALLLLLLLQPTLTFQDGSFCPEGQPSWSAFRDPSFGFGAALLSVVHLHAALLTLLG